MYAWCRSHQMLQVCTFLEHGLEGVRGSLQGNIKILSQAAQVLGHVQEFVGNQTWRLVTCGDMNNESGHKHAT